MLKNKVQKSAKEIENNKLKYFLWPAIIIPLLIGIISHFTGTGLSFTNWKLALSNIHFVCLRNYLEMFTNPDFWNALKVTGIFSGVSLFIEITKRIPIIISKTFYYRGGDRCIPSFWLVDVKNKLVF